MNLRDSILNLRWNRVDLHRLDFNPRYTFKRTAAGGHADILFDQQMTEWADDKFKCYNLESIDEWLPIAIYINTIFRS